MNFLIGVSLSHFCEYHGPVVIMFTEAVSYDEFKKIEKFFHDFPVVKKEENQFCDVAFLSNQVKVTLDLNFF